MLRAVKEQKAFGGMGDEDEDNNKNPKDVNEK
jgi:hypothetical protein